MCKPEHSICSSRKNKPGTPSAQHQEKHGILFQDSGEFCFNTEKSRYKNEKKKCYPLTLIPCDANEPKQIPANAFRERRFSTVLLQVIIR
jgi:hypothetical protein